MNVIRFGIVSRLNRFAVHGAKKTKSGTESLQKFEEVVKKIIKLVSKNDELQQYTNQ